MLFVFVFGIITCVIILKQLFASGSVIIGEYSPRRIIVKYLTIRQEIRLSQNLAKLFFHSNINRMSGLINNVKNLYFAASFVRLQSGISNNVFHILRCHITEMRVHRCHKICSSSLETLCELSKSIR